MDSSGEDDDDDDEIAVNLSSSNEVLTSQNFFFTVNLILLAIFGLIGDVLWRNSKVMMFENGNGSIPHHRSMPCCFEENPLPMV